MSEVVKKNILGQSLAKLFNRRVISCIVNSQFFVFLLVVYQIEITKSNAKGWLVGPIFKPVMLISLIDIVRDMNDNIGHQKGVQNLNKGNISWHFCNCK